MMPPRAHLTIIVGIVNHTKKQKQKTEKAVSMTWPYRYTQRRGLAFCEKAGGEALENCLKECGKEEKREENNKAAWHEQEAKPNSRGHGIDKK